MRILDSIFLTIICMYICTGFARGKADSSNYDWPKYASVAMQVATYSKLSDTIFTHEFTDDVIQVITQATWYGDNSNFDLLKPLGKVQGTTELETLNNVNTKVNHLFKYKFWDFDMWYAEPPMTALLIGSGDCKAFAFYKYWTLRQMGYTNVKLVTVDIPDGDGSIAGHVVVLLNDLWVFDINPPYFYPYRILKADNGLEKAFFPDGSIWDVK